MTEETKIVTEVATEPVVTGRKAAKQTKSVKVSKKVIIDASMTIDDVLALDADGVDLIFEQKEKFLVLDTKTASELSSLNRTRYSMAKDFHDTWRGDEHAEFMAKFQVDKQMSGSATDKLTVAETDLKTRWVLPSKVAERRTQGYKILSADEADSYLGPTSGHHEISHLGQTELVLMGIPKELYAQRQAAKVVKNNELAGAFQGSALSEMRQAGGQPFKPSDSAHDVGHDWQELPAGD